MDFEVLADHKVEIKESEKTKKYLNLSRDIKTVEHEVDCIPIVVGALGAVLKGLEKRLEKLEIRGRIKTIQTKALLRSVRILRRVLETREDLLSNTSERSPMGKTCKQ